MTKSRMRVSLGVLAVTALVSALAPSAAAIEDPPHIPASADWLTTVNYYRAMSGLAPVIEDPSFSAGAYLHSCYMLQNGITHEENPSKPGYTPEGDAAGRSGNVAVSSVYNETVRRHIELWMTGPFHAVGVLRPNLKTVGFGKCDQQSSPTTWRSGATLDVIRGLSGSGKISSPITFPGDGTSTSLNRFITETPNPLTFCGWTGTAGLPVLALMPESAAGAVAASMSGPAGAITTCVLNESNTSGTAQALLRANNVVVVVPRTTLADGTYHVSVATGSRTVDWSFTVDQAAANGSGAPSAPPAPPAPAPTAIPTGKAVGIQPITPIRLVDTRDGLGGARLAGGVVTRIQIAGRSSVPAEALAISANFSVTDNTRAGYLTVWNCVGERPVAATINYGAGETVANGASLPLDADGGLCAFALTDTELVVDVNGFYAVDGPNRFTPLAPSRLLDTRTGFGGWWRLTAGAPVALKVTGASGVPAGAKAVTLNVAGTESATPGYLTVWPCDTDRPLAASLNQVPLKVKANLVVAPLSADGSVCFFSSSDVDIVVDLMGYLSTSATAKFAGSVPFRFTDTRDPRPELNNGNGPRMLDAGQTMVIQIAGVRGVPSGATAVSANIAVTGATAPGFITAWPCGVRPTTSNLNYPAIEATSNGAQLPLSPSGQLCVYTLSAAHVVIDVNGWWTA